MKLDNLPLLSAIEIQKINYKLKTPYVLSFATLESLTSLQVQLQLNTGKSTIAEVVPLFGYSDETEESIWNYLVTKRELLIDKTLDEARSIIEKDIPITPFSTSPFLTAIDLCTWQWRNQFNNKTNFVKPTSTKNIPELLKIVRHSIATKSTVKIKLSGHYNLDSQAIRALENIAGIEEVELRLDANQGYSLSEAVKLFSYLSHSKILNAVSYIEQPLDATDWEGHRYLAANFPMVDIMLDESIVVEGDIIKAIQSGIRFIKLKLFKQGGIKELVSLAKFANERGIKVVLGNGVATYLSNEIELRIHNDYQSYFWGASEANGFLKILE